MESSRSKTDAKATVSAGSVWETRIELDRGEGGISIFNGEKNGRPDEPEMQKKDLRKLVPRDGNGGGGVAPNNKRKTWTYDCYDNPIQIAGGKPQPPPVKRNFEDSSASKSSPVRMRERSNVNGKDQIQKFKSRSIAKGPDPCGRQARDFKSDGGKTSEASSEAGKSDGNSSLNLIGAGEDEARVANPPKHDRVSLDVCDENCTLNEDETGENAPDERSKVKNNKSLELSVSRSTNENQDVGGDGAETPELRERAFRNSERRSLKESIHAEKILRLERPRMSAVNKDERRARQFETRTVSTGSRLQSTRNPNVSERSVQAPEGCDRCGRLQTLVDLLMWRDVSRSAFVFGVGTFSIISSSFSNGFNVSFISVVSYMAMAYLFVIFLYKSLTSQPAADDDANRCFVGEDDVTWILKSVLPCINELLLRGRSLFSGDPATTMKMAVFLFVLARCGSSITLWMLCKLGFFCAFTLPKLYSSYSAQLAASAKFWFRRFHDLWNECTHKKAVALAIFVIVWNLSSMVARLWAVFMMYVAVRYYQQTVDDEEDHQLRIAAHNKVTRSCK